MKRGELIRRRAGVMSGVGFTRETSDCTRSSQSKARRWPVQNAA